MVEILKKGQTRIGYQASNFGVGVSVKSSIWGPTSNSWNSGNAFTEVGEGIYYLDYTFPNSGAYIFKFAEDGSAQTTQTYRVWDIENNLKAISGNIDIYGGGGGTTYVYPSPKKSPWTHKQKDDTIKQVNSILDMLMEIHNEITESKESHIKDSNEIKAIMNSKISELEITSKSLKNSQDMYVRSISNEIDEIIDSIKDMKSELNYKDELNGISSKIDELNHLTSIAIKNMSDKELEGMINELEGKSSK